MVVIRIGNASPGNSPEDNIAMLYCIQFLRRNIWLGQSWLHYYLATDKWAPTLNFREMLAAACCSISAINQPTWYRFNSMTTCQEFHNPSSNKLSSETTSRDTRASLAEQSWLTRQLEIPTKPKLWLSLLKTFHIIVKAKKQYRAQQHQLHIISLDIISQWVSTMLDFLPHTHNEAGKCNRNRNHITRPPHI